MSARSSLFGAAILLVAGSAHANGSFPTAGQLVVDPADPTHLVLRTTFGMVTSHDAGAGWGWVCESSAGYVNEEPGIAVAGDGAILAGVEGGMSLANAGACDWGFAPGIDPLVKDVSVQRDDPAVAVAVTTDVAGVTRLWESIDHGQSWSQAGVDLPGFQATTLDAAPSDPMRVYIAGLDAMSKPVLARTDNRGQSWEVTPIVTSAAGAIPYLSAVDPLDPDLVYVRADADPGLLLVSNDGGARWSEPFTGTGPMRGFALSPDGQTLLLSDILGVYRAPTSTLAFTQVSDVFVTCLTWAAAGVYACSNEYVEAFFVGFSGDEGASFSPLLHMFCISGPLACGADTTVGANCPGEWPAISMQIDTDKCVSEGTGGTGPGSGGAGGTGGASAVSTGPGGPGATSASAGGSGGGAGATPTPEHRTSEGCSCQTGSHPQTPWLALAGSALVAAMITRSGARARGAPDTARRSRRAPRT